jgi:hypothetical protein
MSAARSVGWREHSNSCPVTDLVHVVEHVLHTNSWYHRPDGRDLEVDIALFSRLSIRQRNFNRRLSQSAGRTPVRCWLSAFGTDVF